MRVAFDIGGTFTDVIILPDSGRISSTKVLSLHDRVGDDIATYIDKQVCTEPVERFVHATTICSNAVIENTVAPTGLLTTRGFRDTLELRQQKGPSAPSKDWRPPAPLIPRQLCLEVSERILSNGEIETALDEGSCRLAVEELVAAGVEVIVVCLINSYVNPQHERQVNEIIRSVAPNVVVCLSSDVHPEVREYERTSTTVINGALTPVVNRYLDKIEKSLVRHSPRLHIMQSNGGIMTSHAARRRPISMVESGPAAGVLAAARLAREMGLPQVLSFDMGGTTAKACLIQDGIPLERAGGEIGAATTVGGEGRSAGYALRVPTIDLVEVGAGGGSIAWVDGESLRVGPISASADPGPVCYGRGGTEPTVTDANVVLGRMNPRAIADGTLTLDLPAARAAVSTLAERLSVDVLPLAYGITQVANAVMMRALRAVSTERGFDPRGMTLVAFGGAGALHAAELADTLGIRAVVIPPFSGVFSAMGLLLADYRIDYVASVVRPLHEVDPTVLIERFAELERQASEEFGALGVPADRLRFDRIVDLKYSYQVEDTGIPFAHTAAEDLVAELSAKFDATHDREFGFIGSGTKLLVNLRVRATAPADPIRFEDFSSRRMDAAASASSTRPDSRDVYFGPTHGTHLTPIVTRSTVDEPHDGPVIVEEPDSTIVVPPGWRVSKHANSSLCLSKL